ncbi:hypothetical protein GCM10017687_11540 [Streptomyces echinatus]
MPSCGPLASRYGRAGCRLVSGVATRLLRWLPGAPGGGPAFGGCRNTGRQVTVCVDIEGRVRLLPLASLTGAAVVDRAAGGVRHCPGETSAAARPRPTMLLRPDDALETARGSRA